MPEPRHPAAVKVGRVYDQPADAGVRVLVDRLWPRGMKRDDPRVGHWLPEVAPSSELRKWYGHEPDKFEEFRSRYEQELAAGEAAAAFAELKQLVRGGDVTLVTASRAADISQAAVLAELLG